MDKIVNIKDIKTIKYLDLECFIYNNHQYNNYINVSKWTNGRRNFSHWYRLKSTKELVLKFIEKIGRSDLIISILKISNKYKGTYMHIDLSIQFAQWISSDFAFKISQLVKSNVILKYEEQIIEKDNTILILNNNVEQLKETSNKLYNDNNKIQTELQITNNNLKKLNNIVNKISINTVPTNAWNKFCIFKINFIYKVIRCKNSDYKSIIRKYLYNNLVFEITLPNGIEYFSTFKKQYARNKQNNESNKINIYYNDITLNENTTENDLIEMLKQHETRIQKLISSSL